MQRKEATLIVNPNAHFGGTLKQLPAVEAALSAHQFDLHSIQSKSIEHAQEVAQAAARAGRLVIAFGGDGFLGKVASSLARSDATLAVLPGGRGNDFVRSMQIPRDPIKACDVIAAGKTKRIDLGQVGDQLFLCTVTMGYEGLAAKKVNEIKLFKNILGYLYAGILASIQWRVTKFTVGIDGVEQTFRGYTVTVANSRAHGGSMYIAPHARVDDGLLDVIVNQNTSKFGFIRSFICAIRDRFEQAPNIYMTKASEVTVKTDRPVFAYADGEEVQSPPLTVRVVPQALNLIIP